MKGFVYFFKHNNVDAVKIGYTTNDDLSSRFSAFKTSSPYGASILGFIKCSNAPKKESELHQELKAHRLNGEFFEITEEKVNFLINKHSSTNGLESSTLLKIEEYVKTLNSIERSVLLSKVNNFFDSLLLSEKDIACDLSDNEKEFMSKYSNNNGNLCLMSCTDIMNRYFPESSLRKVGVFLKKNGYKQILSKKNGKTGRLYRLFI